MEKRMLLAVVLSMAILFGFQYFFQQAAPLPEVTEGTKSGAGWSTASVADPKTAKSTPESSPQSVKPMSQPISRTDVPEKEIKVETALYSAVFSSHGGVLKSLELLRYKDSEGKNIVLKSDNTLPALSIGNDETFQTASEPFSVNSNNVKLASTGDTAELIFESSGGGKSIRRTYRFHGGDYRIDLKDEVSGINSYWITPGKNFGIIEKDDSVHFGPVILQDTDRHEYTSKDLKEPKTLKGKLVWLAQEDKYFFSAIVPSVQPEEARVWADKTDVLVAFKMNQGTNSYVIYAGPKEHEMLKLMGVGLEHIVDFGFFSFLAVPLFWVLKLFYKLTGNYGAAIILLTIVVRIPFIPLINKGQQSMKKLQDLQPKMAELREKYKSDPQRMQREIMELYKKYKVNPMGGCLPMLLQIPFFFALYKVLLLAIELRSAPFMLWVTDLSAKDPYYILPIIMGATMVIQQKMTPSSMEPMQQKMMMLMPVIFTFMFLNFASGLVLYWLINNILSIAQQWHVNKKAAANPA